jgi:hypothetical protein
MRAGVERWAPWVAGLVLVVCSAGYAFSRPGPVEVAQTSTQDARAGVRLDPKASLVARAFVQTAVARRDLDGAWWLVASNLRGGLSRAEWRTGSIPVEAYPVATARVSYRTKVSHPDRALIAVTFRPRSGARPRQFLLGLQRGGRGPWLVTSWSAVSTVAPAPPRF